MIPLGTITEKHISPMENYLGKTLSNNTSLESFQQAQLIDMLQKHNNAFVWDYTDMKGIHPNLCIHHISTK